MNLSCEFYVLKLLKPKSRASKLCWSPGSALALKPFNQFVSTKPNSNKIKYLFYEQSYFIKRHCSFKQLFCWKYQCISWFLTPSNVDWLYRHTGVYGVCTGVRGVPVPVIRPVFYLSGFHSAATGESSQDWLFWFCKISWDVCDRQVSHHHLLAFSHSICSTIKSMVCTSATCSVMSLLWIGIT